MSSNNILSEGIRFYNQKRYEDALAFFLALPENSGADNVELAYYMGLCYTKLFRYDDALLYLEQVVTGGTDIDRVLQCRFLLAVIYALSGRHRLADFELNKLLETGYNTSSVYASLAYIRWEQNDIEKCLEYYRKSLESDPENITALNGLGYVLASGNKDLTQALGYCQKALKNSPNNPACLDSLGWIYYKLGIYDKAHKYLNMAKEKLPDNEDVNLHIALLKKAEENV